MTPSCLDRYRACVCGVLLSLLGGTFSLQGQASFPIWESHGEGVEAGDALDGELLVSGLRCTACHRSKSEWGQSAIVSDLTESIPWMRTGSLYAFLFEPDSLRPHGKMPDLLAGFDQEKRAAVAEALTAYLLSVLQESEPGGDPIRGDTERGRVLAQTIGCRLCHSLGTTENAAGVGGSLNRISLERIVDWYQPDGLTRFLLNKQSGHGGTRAAGLRLSSTEAQDLTAFLIPEERESGEESRGFDADSTLVARGERYYRELNCGACHDLGERVVKVSGEPHAPAWDSLRAVDKGCLAKNTGERVASYNLTEQQRRSLTLVLDREDSPRSNVRNENELHREMVRHRCFVCHERDGQTRLTSDSVRYFPENDSDLGDEGRLPPSLTGVGRKLRQEVIHSTLTKGFPVRPYLAVRMPVYSDEIADRLAGWFAERDIPADEVPSIRRTRENEVGRNMWGRALVGTSGLGCINCHQLGNRKSLGIQAMDMKWMPQRLRPEWFRDYLIAPGSFRPQTKMPSFWPDGQPSLKGFGGTPHRQIDSIWAYLLELDQSRLPEGLADRRALRLIPEGKPLVFRTFLEGVGNHAIAVGFPDGLHAGFDAQQCRWAVAWRGDFLDAESTWEDRFTPLAKPLGDSVVQIQNHRVDEGEVAMFLGYRIDLESGAPQFQYRIGECEIDDVMVPDRLDSSRLLRTLNIVGETRERVDVELASGRFRSFGEGKWRDGDRLRISVRGVSDQWITASDERLVITLGATAAGKNVEVLYEW